MLVRRHGDWAVDTAAVGLLVALLGAWVFFAPLVGPYFEFGFHTDETWLFEDTQWTLSLIPGLVALAGGLLLMLPGASSRLGTLLALLAGGWLVIGPSVHPLWESGELVPLADSEGRRALLWIAYFYGAGALLTVLGGIGLGRAAWRRAAAIEEVAAEPEELEPAPPEPEAAETPAERTVIIHR
jgi:hypothetical protein